MTSKQIDLPWTTRRRLWWVAGTLSYLVPGLGQLYTGAPERGMAIWIGLGIWGSALFMTLLRLMSSGFPTWLIWTFYTGLLIYGAGYIAAIADAIKRARKTPADYVMQRFNRWWLYLAVVLIIHGMDYYYSRTLRSALLKPYRIASQSMEPTLLQGDYVLSDRHTYLSRPPRRGDLVVVKTPVHSGDVYLKRLVALPGDTVMVIDGRLSINSRLQDEPFIQLNGDFRQPFGPVALKSDEYFLLGDNRYDSYDSRHWGPVKREHILGRAGLIYMSWQKGWPFGRWNRFGEKIE